MSRAGQASIAAVLAELEALSRAALAARWQHRFGVAAPRAVGRGMLLQGLAYDAQRRRWCGLSARTCRQLAQIAQGCCQSNRNSSPIGGDVPYPA